MNRRHALPALFLACLLAVPVLPPGEARAESEPVRYAAYGEVPEVTGIETECMECGGKNGSHRSNCPYARGGGSDSGEERAPHVDITHAPIFVAPAGFIGGIFMGGGWFFGEMAGKYPDVGFFDSYHNYMSIKSDDKQFSGPFNAGTHAGGLPWLVLGAVTVPIRAGIVALADLASRPSPPPPPKAVDPNIAVYEAIANGYRGFRDAAKTEFDKAAGDVRAAELRREKYLDAFIADRPELCKLRDAEGVEAARARAAGKLDAWSRSRDEKAKLAAALRDDIREKDAFCRAAIEKVGLGSFLVDLQVDKTATDLKTMKDDLSLPKEIREAYGREHKLTDRISKMKSSYDIATDLKSLAESGARAHREGKDLTEWIGEAETKESLLRLNLKLLAVPETKLAVGKVAGGAETLMDIIYATAANTYFAAHVEKERALLGELATARVFEDVMGDDWKRINVPIEAARNRVKTIGAKVDRYANLVTENEANANKYR